MTYALLPVSYWHCPVPTQYAEQGLCNGRVSFRPSLRLSVCLFHHSTAAAACDGFAAERPCWQGISIVSGKRRAPTALQHGAQQQMRAVPC